MKRRSPRISGSDTYPVRVINWGMKNHWIGFSTRTVWMMGAAFCVLAGIYASSGCSASRARSDSWALPAPVPSDFALGVVVFGDSDGSSPDTRSARYVFDPDGTLRCAVGAGSRAQTHPPITRRVHTSQRRDIYQHVRSLGIASEEGGGEFVSIHSPEVYRPDSRTDGLAVYLIEIRAGGVSRAFAIDSSDPGANELVRLLAELGWIRG